MKKTLSILMVAFTMTAMVACNKDKDNEDSPLNIANNTLVYDGQTYTFDHVVVDTEVAKISIVGGGIGIAPVANFASSLPEKSYDFFASFKSGSYGLDFVRPRELILTTDDGSEGIKGMLPTAFTCFPTKPSSPTNAPTSTIQKARAASCGTTRPSPLTGKP